MSPPPNSPTADLQQANADLQRQLAEARAERDESEAQKAAIAEVLGVINSSPSDLAPVFDAMLEKAMRLCAGRGIQRCAEHQRSKRSSQFDRRCEGAGALI